MEKGVSAPVKVGKPLVGFAKVWLSIRKLFWVIRKFIWYKRYGIYGKLKDQTAMKKHLRALLKTGFQHRLEITKSDDVNTQIMKAIDNVSVQMIAYTLNWCLGLVNEPPFEMVKRLMRDRKHNTTLIAALTKVLSDYQISKDTMFAALEEVERSGENAKQYDGEI